MAHIPTTMHRAQTSNLLYHPSCVRTQEITQTCITPSVAHSIYQQYLKRTKASPLTLTITIDVNGTHTRSCPVYVACRKSDTDPDQISAQICLDGGILDGDCDSQQFRPLSSRRTEPRAAPRPLYCPYGDITTRVLNTRQQ